MSGRLYANVVSVNPFYFGKQSDNRNCVVTPLIISFSKQNPERCQKPI